MQNRMKFFEAINALAEVLGGDLSEAKLGIYEAALEPYSDVEIGQAINRAASTLKWFPKPVELIELIQGKADDRAAGAWGVALETIKSVGKYKSVVFEDPKISRVVEAMGGWIEFCGMTVDETSIKCGQFQKLYRALSDDVDRRQLAGIEELERRRFPVAEALSPVFIRSDYLSESVRKQIEARAGSELFVKRITEGIFGNEKTRKEVVGGGSGKHR